MDSAGFIDIRRKLEKTQKEVARLLGISLKAVCSYEQGWRSIPCYIERQLVFLLVRRLQSDHQASNCWEIRNCPEEKKKNCPAWEFGSGDCCWFIGGTICDNTIYTTWEEKFEVCKQCDILKQFI